jgi:DNA-binding transcriptional LysR family regulator
VKVEQFLPQQTSSNRPGRTPPAHQRVRCKPDCTTLLVVTYLAVPAALAGSDLVATVPRRVAELIAATARVAVTPLPIDFALTVSMAWHRRAATDPAQSWFRSLLIEAAAA